MCVCVSVEGGRVPDGGRKHNGMLCYVMLCYVMLCYGHFSELGVGLHGKYAYIFILDAL